jgi:hypothetical protein
MDDMRADMKLVLDMTTRVDERLKSICEKQQEVNSRLNQFSDTLSDMMSRVRVLEAGHDLYTLDDMDRVRDRLTMIEAKGSPAFIQDQKETEGLIAGLTTHITNVDRRLSRIEESNQGFWGRVNKFTQMVTHGIWVIVVCYLLLRLNLTIPAIP